MQPFRIAPRLPVEAVKTYQISKPIPTHFRPGSCAEARCENMQHGWQTIVDEATDLGARQARYIRRDSSRRFTETRDESGLTMFIFEPGQTCFAHHQISLEREPLYIVRGGDWRGNPRGETWQHANADDWVDDCANHQQALADRLSQG